MKNNLLVFLLFLGIAEGGARAWTHFFGNPVDRALSVLQPDTALGWTARRGLNTEFFGAALITDANGRRETPGPGGRPELWTFGPSSAFGWGVKSEETYTALIANAMKLTPTNFSQIGYSSRQGISLLSQSMLPVGGVTLFAFGINDLDRFRFFFPTPVPDAEFFAAPIPPIAYRIAKAAADSHSFRYLTRLAGWIRTRIDCRLPARMPRRVSDEDFAQNLDEFLRQSRSKKNRLIVIDTPYWPVEFEPKNDADFLYSQAQAAAETGACRKSRELFRDFLSAETHRIILDQRRLNRLAADWAQKNRVALVTASSLLRERSDFVDPIHPSPAGHEKISGAVLRLLQKEKN